MITQEELKSLLSYDPETGEFTWLVNRRRVRQGNVAGYLEKSGYKTILVNYKRYLAHRLAWFYVYGSWPPDEIDHKNRNRADNRISNLRCVSRHQNMNNLQCKGYSYNAKRKKYEARFRYKGKLIFLGRFSEESQAKEAYEQARQKYVPEMCSD